MWASRIFCSFGILLDPLPKSTLVIRPPYHFQPGEPRTAGSHLEPCITYSPDASANISLSILFHVLGCRRNH